MYFSVVVISVVAGIAGPPTPRALEAVDTIVRKQPAAQLDVAAVERLTAVRPDFNCTTLRFDVALDHVDAMVKSRPEEVRSFSVHLDLAPGHSFVVSGVVVNLLAAFRGQLVVGNGTTADSWTIKQFNFLNQGPRSYYDASVRRLSLVLPVVLEKGDVGVHALLNVRGALVGREVRWDTLRFAATELVAQAFPTSPPVHQTLSLPTLPIAETSAVPLGGHACCMGAWCAQCASACAAGGCSYVCESCTPDGCRFPDDCDLGGPQCCYQ